MSAVTAKDPLVSRYSATMLESCQDAGCPARVREAEALPTTTSCSMEQDVGQDE